MTASAEIGKFMEGNIRGFLLYNATLIEEIFSLNFKCPPFINT
jgi:hypothetical protein